MKVKLRDFQSISDAELEFLPGITLIQGPSASGKTAVLRAIKTALLNPNGTKHFIKHGKSETRVTLENLGECLEWSRNKSTVSYSYKGVDYPKASKQNSFDYCNLGFLIGPKGELMNMLDEWSLLFPFGESDTELFKIFEDIFCIADSAKIIDGMKADENSCNKDLADHKNKKAEIESRMQTIKDFFGTHEDKSEVILAVFKNKETDLERLKETRANLEKLKDLPLLDIEVLDTTDLTNSLQELDNLVRISNSLHALPKEIYLPEPYAFNPDTTELNKLQDVKKEITCNLDTNNLVNLIKMYEQSLTVLNEKWKSLDVCPLCGHSMKGQ